jgi:pSer/pThr/pTyr-binding forkhead associated (FHA) protein
MSLDIVLLILRILVALVLYAFLGMAFFFILKDIKIASYNAGEDRYPPARLIVIENEDAPHQAGETYALKRLTTIGRGPTNTIILPDSFASTFHAQITYRGGQWWLQDQQSHNGTLLNDVLLDDVAVLSSGDIIGIGRMKLLVELG